MADAFLPPHTAFYRQIHTSLLNLPQSLKTSLSKRQASTLKMGLLKQSSFCCLLLPACNAMACFVQTAKYGSATQSPSKEYIDLAMKLLSTSGLTSPHLSITNVSSGASSVCKYCKAIECSIGSEVFISRVCSSYVLASICMNSLALLHVVKRVPISELA
jgi:hypothetical protein